MAAEIDLKGIPEVKLARIAGLQASQNVWLQKLS